MSDLQTRPGVTGSNGAAGTAAKIAHRARRDAPVPLEVSDPLWLPGASSLCSRDSTPGWNRRHSGMLIDVFEHVEDYLGFLRPVAPLGRRMLGHVPLDMSAQMLARASRFARFGSRWETSTTSRRTGRSRPCETPATGSRPPAPGETIDTPNRTLRMKLAAWPRQICFGLAPDLAVRILGGYSLLVLCERMS